MSFFIYFNFQRGMFILIRCVDADNKSILTLSAISHAVKDLSRVRPFSLSSYSPLDPSHQKLLSVCRYSFDRHGLGGISLAIHDTRK